MIETTTIILAAVCAVGLLFLVAVAPMSSTSLAASARARRTRFGTDDMPPSDGHRTVPQPSSGHPSSDGAR